MSKASKSNSRVLSTWTPLSNEESNKKVFMERRELFCKWFEKWSEPQRKRVVNDILKLSSQSQLKFTDQMLAERLPTKEHDFTRVLPRVLSLYLFSFLDPRTLCRCAQVCWYWKYLAELDQLWMMKCLRLGWTLPFSPGPYEHGLWKRSYVENLKSLQYLKTQINIDDHMRSLTMGSPKSYRSILSQHSRQGSAFGGRKSGPVKPAWRGSDPTPKDTWRYNYLNNDDDVEIVKAMRQHGLSGPKSASLAANAKSKTKTGKHVLNTKSKSLNKLNVEETMEEKIYGGRPDWAKPNTQGVPAADYTLSSKTNEIVASPVRTTNASSHRGQQPKYSARSERDLPSSSTSAFEKFTQKPWNIPDQVDSD
ncbi:F-box only protein 16-like isoform X2 [Watersipora subatra]|uniref:F-box only protein 16-like isoform X2 n=1 Tax=Watersipora subatra TaxID=2589382 RepID=UPI00355BDAD6